MAASTHHRYGLDTNVDYKGVYENGLKERDELNSIFIPLIDFSILIDVLMMVVVPLAFVVLEMVLLALEQLIHLSPLVPDPSRSFNVTFVACALISSSC
ncbi:unnamed protein product [Gongylonema pulchrum]|uniref:Transmembrane protein n=1 Tax=Gongylonema pulchrum TaxID=637853 RepID=A0A183D494_9BILA|nr:unnamed protein product [Gongylonema pulchrum]